MSYKYFPHTKEDIKEMLAKIGVSDLESLYAEVPEKLLLKENYDIPEEMSELEIRAFFDKLGHENQQLTCFAGAGVYDHYIPSVVPNLIERSEFLTTYTPYQAEISQGTLHYIFEFQSMMAELTGMEVSNASMYDGTTATAEAMMLADNVNRKADTVLLAKTMDPKIIAVVLTYAHFHGTKIEFMDHVDGRTSLGALKARLLQGNIAGVIVQQPNYYGIIEDFSGYAEACHENKSLFIINSVAADLALLKTPGEWGADIAVGDVQSLGLPMAFGGPYAGYMCSTEKLLRKLPGRIVGETYDNRGQRAFVLTLQAREQHIRRQKATSNICSNESLMALFVTIYMSVMGKQGIKEAAQIGYDGAHTLCDQLLEINGVELVYPQPFFNEFLVQLEHRDILYDTAVKSGVLPGIKIGKDQLLIAVTEKRCKEEVDQLVTLFSSVISHGA